MLRGSLTKRACQPRLAEEQVSSLPRSFGQPGGRSAGIDQLGLAACYAIDDGQVQRVGVIVSPSVGNPNALTGVTSYASYGAPPEVGAP